jgi:hypothetical protein
MSVSDHLSQMVILLLIKIVEDAQKLAKSFLKDAEADLQILVDIRQELQSTKPSIPKGRRNSQDTLSNWRRGTLNSNTGTGTQYNNADRGKQYNAKTQVFGKDPVYYE